MVLLRVVCALASFLACGVWVMVGVDLARAGVPVWWLGFDSVMIVGLASSAFVHVREALR